MGQQGNAAVPHIYLISTDVPAETVEILFATLPPVRAEKAARLLRAEARAQSILGFCLVRYALYAETGRVFDVDWLTTDNGKPYLLDAPHFSLSHTAHAVAIAVSHTREVGIDIEEVRHHHPRLAERICSEVEILLLQRSSDPTKELIRIFSAKEAEGKRLGTGLKSPKDISTKDVRSTCLILDGVPHVLSLSPATEPLQIKWVTPDQLLSIER